MILTTRRDLKVKSFYQNWKLDPELPMDIYQSTNITFYPHFHAEIEFIYVLSGTIRIGVNEEIRLLRQGDMVICGSNDIHYFDSRELESEIIILICKPEWITMTKSWPSDFRFASPYIPAGTPGLETVKTILDELIREKDEKKPGYPLLLKAGILKLCGSLQRAVDTLPMDRTTKEKYESRRARMQQILSYIEDHYREELNVKVMAKRFFHGALPFQPFLQSRHRHEFQNLSQHGSRPKRRTSAADQRSQYYGNRSGVRLQQHSYV